jgi:hypothetical protein
MALCNITQNDSLFYDDELFVHAHPGAGRPPLTGCLQLQYAVYSEVPSISGGHFFHAQPEDAPCHGDKGLT